jgi:hypothetical protein
VKYDSVKAVGRHARHISKVRANLRSPTVDSYFVKTGTSEEQEVSCAELVLTYHGVKTTTVICPKTVKIKCCRALCVQIIN